MKNIILSIRYSNPEYFHGISSERTFHINSETNSFSIRCEHHIININVYIYYIYMYKALFDFYGLLCTSSNMLSYYLNSPQCLVRADLHRLRLVQYVCASVYM